jgi:hypothetical protein
MSLEDLKQHCDLNRSAYADFEEQTATKEALLAYVRRRHEELGPVLAIAGNETRNDLKPQEIATALGRSTFPGVTRQYLDHLSLFRVSSEDNEPASVKSLVELTSEIEKEPVSPWKRS